MKNSLKTLALMSTVLTLTACGGLTSTYDEKAEVPYTLERTATAKQKAAPEPMPAPVVEPAPAPAPVVQQCDYSAWESRVAALESELASCRESSSRVRDAYREELEK